MNRKLIVFILLVSGAGLLLWQVLFSHPGERLFKDPEFAQSRNSASCASCHDGGAGIGNIQGKTSFVINTRSFNSVEAVIDEVMIPVFLEGKPIGKKSQPMKDLVDYLRQLYQEK